MNKYIITIIHKKLNKELVVRSEGNTEVEAKENVRRFLNGNCIFKHIKCISKF